MKGFRWAKIGLLLADGDRYAPYFRELIEHVGLQFDLMTVLDSNAVQSFDVVILAGYGRCDGKHLKWLEDFVRNGGSLVFLGSTWDALDLIGLEGAPVHASNEMVQPTSPSPYWPETSSGARTYGGEMGLGNTISAFAEARSKYVAIGRRDLGSGSIFFFGPHVGQTLCLMGLGRAVECDGIGPSDGSAILDDANLRAEDGTNLSFESDRASLPNCPAPFFAYPHVDVLRDAMTRTILQAIVATGKRAALFWHWPNNANAVSTLTLECEQFDPDKVLRVHRMLSMYGSPAAWLVAPPGYPLDVYRAMNSWDHEIGLIFATDDNGGWHEEKMKIQTIALSRACGSGVVDTARPIDGKWRGWKQFYDICETAGPRLSMSKGGRQPGTAGFLFGTSHLFYPLKKEGAPYLTAELPVTAPFPGVVTQDAACDAILAQTMATNGCIAMSFKPEQIDHPEASASLRRLISLCKQNRLEAMLPNQILQFERGRRSLKVFSNGAGDSGALLLAADFEMEGLTVLVLGDDYEVAVRGRQANTPPVKRYGVTFRATVVNLEAKKQADLRFDVTQNAAA